MPVLARAQVDSLGLSSWKTKTLVIKENQPFRLDSLPIIPKTLEIFYSKDGSKVSDTYYEINTNQLTWKGKNLPDTIDLRYQVLTMDLERKFNRLDTNYIKVDPTSPPEFVYDPFAINNSNKDILDLDGVNYTGSFARGISFGNSQNLVLNSSLNLQMSGTVGDDIEILAAISDQNIPLQPEGNTQNIQDFDRVFIQLKRKRTSLIAGDFDLRRPEGYFMNYNKKLQGARFEDVSDVLGGEWKNTAGFAISGGKFARQNIQVVEGNQGPYKLRGNENELFIIVLSGTERVFNDGILMERGELNDYVIDYNRGEISFTANRLITKDSRIIVEFEYTDQNYLRFLYTLGSEYKKGKWTGRLNFYNEQDSKSSSGNQELSEAQIEFLTNAGDNLEGQFAPGLDSLEEFTSDRITYALVDTLVNGNLYQEILIYNVNPDSAKYTARFTELGQNKGNYVLSANAANGRVYAWVAPNPNTGEPQGNYEPVIQLIAPQKKQLLTVGGRYDIGKQSFIGIEAAMSQNDLNRFSDVDQADDRGVSLRLDYQHLFEIKEKDIIDNGKNKVKWQLTPQIAYEYKQRNFEALSPYRSAEFSRDWNIENNEVLDEHMAQAGLSVRKLNLGTFSYDFGTFLRGSSYTGIRHSYQTNIKSKGFNIRSKGSFVQTNNGLEKTFFSRPNFDISKKFEKIGGLRIGVTGEREKNRRTDLLTDSLQANSFHFDIIGAYLETTASKKSKFSLRYRRRYDYAILDNQFQNNTIADEVNLAGNWNPSKVSRLNWNMTYRNLQIQNEQITNQEALETYLGRIEHQLRAIKGLIRSTTSYEISSGQEPEREFVYQKVNDGEGVYTWLDRNNDSIPQLDEFEIAVFQDQANYIRVNTITDRYVRSNLVQFTNNLYLEPKAIWFREEKGFRAVMSKLAFQSTVRINRKVRLDDNVNQWNPFALDVPDSTLVSLNSSYRATLYFNRSNPKYDIRIGLNHNRNRVVLTTGFESRALEERFLAFRWNLTKQWSINTQLSEGWRNADSEFFDNKDFRIRWYKLEPKLTFQPNQKFRLVQSYEYQQGNNRIENFESILQHDANVELTYNQSSKTAVRSKLSFVSIKFTGENNTPVSFAMLEGLQNGNNYLWTITFDRKLSKNLLLSLTYDGRKTGTADMVHVGRASVRANF